ncbi:hypothetical protein Q1695_015063 [Nippostrongylus brasiliensis]|nr:hypothetical protein Q1695_015063 [Nippostrongylus brasiliensis]
MVSFTTRWLSAVLMRPTFHFKEDYAISTVLFCWIAFVAAILCGKRKLRAQSKAPTAKTAIESPSKEVRILIFKKSSKHFSYKELRYILDSKIAL